MTIINNATKYKGGGATNPKGLAKGEKGINMPVATIKIEVRIKNLLGLLSIKGILPVRITCITRVWVHKDSINHPVWNNSAEA
jgi:hypothetical protein